MNCLVIANGEVEYNTHMRTMIEAADVVVCADGGAGHLRKMSMVPDVVIGDLDSLGGLDLKYLEEHKVDIIQYPVKKDAGDTELAVLWAIEKGASDITLTGVTGTRLDHTLANIFLLKTISEQGISCRIIDAKNEVYLISGEFTIKGKPGELLSIVPVTEKVTGLTLSGLEYPLKDAVLTMGSSRGISNVFVEEVVCISLKHGIIIVTKSKD